MYVYIYTQGLLPCLSFKGNGKKILKQTSKTHIILLVTLTNIHTLSHTLFHSHPNTLTLLYTLSQTPSLTL